MQDRFQFRVWDKYTHETPAEQMQFLCFNGCLVDCDGCHHSPDDYIVEQCTGLKDKNGKLIFEGDIVRYWWNQKTNTGTIFWNNEFARFCIANNETHCQEDSNCFMFVSDKKIIEIVGNIHQPSEG